MLPKWLAEPDMIERDIKSNLIPLCDVPGICPLLQKKLEANGIQTFFPGQRDRFIPEMMSDIHFFVFSYQSFASIINSSSRGDPRCPGECEFGASDRSRRLQAQRHLCVCAYRKRKDAGVCYTCHTGVALCIGHSVCCILQSKYVQMFIGSLSLRAFTSIF